MENYRGRTELTTHTECIVRVLSPFLKYTILGIFFRPNRSSLGRICTILMFNLFYMHKLYGTIKFDGTVL